MNLNCGEFRLSKNTYFLFPYISYPKSIEIKNGVCIIKKYSCKCRLGTYFKIINEKNCFGFTFRVLGFGILYLENS
jgi:hypothetical protein